MAATPPLSTPAPGELEFVRAFVNSIDIEAGVDSLADEESWRRWARTAGVDGRDGPVGPVDPAELQAARALREALREGMLANHDLAPLPDSVADALTSAARASGAQPRFTPLGLRLDGPREGLPGVVTRIAEAVAAAISDGTWSRLKACRNDGCRWGFYDQSRSRTGQWCSMAICGNRAKQSRWRARPDRDARS